MSKGLAPQWSAYARQLRNTPGPLMGASLAGLPFLTNALPSARVVVEIAWGADPSGDDALWSWTDITGTVYQKPGINFGYGRSNEASITQPARGSMTLDNSDASYSLGGVSPNWPNVKHNVPIRVRVDPDGTGFQVIFQGNVVGFTPDWDTTGNIAIVNIAISGTLRRLQQGKTKKESAARRYYTRYYPLHVSFSPSIYYPLDEGPLATSGFAAIGSGSATIDPVFLDLAGDSTTKFFGQGKLAPWMQEGISLNKLAVLRMPVPQSPGLTEWWLLDILVSYAEGDAENGLFESIQALENGTSTWGVRFDAFNKEITAVGYVAGAGPVDLTTVSHTTLFDGDVHHVRLWVDQEGADVHVVLYVDDTFVLLGSQATQTLRHPNEILVFASSNAKRYFGHAIWGTNVSQMLFGSTGAYYSRGATGELATTRLIRLCEEDAIPLSVIGNTGSTSDTAAMGPQPTDGIVPLLRQCEVGDQGVLFDGKSAGLTYVCRQDRENRSADLIIDVGAGELFPPFKPTHDDARRVNIARAKRTYGTESTYEDVDGPLGTDAIGEYSDSIDANIDSDDQISDYASWIVNLGTVEGYRYPTVSINLEENPHLVTSVLALRPGSRIDLTNVGATLQGHPVETVSLFVEGIQMQMTPFSWIVTFQCSPFVPWRIITLAADTGDTTETLCHLDTDGSQITTGADAAATSLTVETLSGPIWTTDSDDFPFDISVGGVKATVTNIVGASSPQTFTINPLSLSRPSHSPVEVWSPPVLRL